MRKKQPCSLRNVAELAAVSRMAASLALRDDPRIPAATRKRIKAAARKLGYKPNPRFARLMAEAACARHGVPIETIAYVMTEPANTGFAMYNKIYFTMAKQRAAELGFALEPWCMNDPSVSPARSSKDIWSRGIQGVIISNVSRHMFEALGGTLPIDWRRFTVVDIGGALLTPRVSVVRHSHYAGMIRVLDELEALGLRRIGLCVRREDDLRTHHRWSSAYLLWRAMRGHDDRSLTPLLLGEVETEPIVEWVHRERLEAVVSPGTAVLHALRQGGLRVPEDISFATLHAWGPGAARVSGINQEMRGIHRAAVDLVVSMLRQGEVGIPKQPIYWTFPGRWMAGHSVRPARSSGAGLLGIEREPLRFPGDERSHT